MKLFGKRIAIFLGLFALVHPLAAAPRIASDKTTLDYGHVPPGSSVTNIFKITNTGDETLLINRVKGSCGCTSVDIATNSLLPGASTTLKAVIDLRGRNGAQNKLVFIFSNDPANATLVLSLMGSVAADHEFSPAQISAGRIRGTVASQFTATFQNNTPAALSVTNVIAQSPGIRAEFTTLTNGRTYLITAQTVPPISEGPFKTTLIVETDSPVHPRFELPFEALVSDRPVTVIPPAPLSASSPGNTSRYIVLTPDTVKSFTIQSVETPDASVSSQIVPAIGGNRRVLLMFGKITTDLNGKNVKLHTDIPGMNEILVPLTVTP